MQRPAMSTACLLLLILLGQSGQIVPIGNSTLVSKSLALIVMGAEEFAGASERCFNLMSSPWAGCEILYLSTNLSRTPRANMTADRANLHLALTSWLNSSSTSATQVSIWVFCHGLGLHHHSPLYQTDEEWWSTRVGGGRPNLCSGPEITEYLIDEDVNGDGVKSNTTWVGVDNGICFNLPSGTEIVWDDELRDWLVGVNCRRMMIYIGACRSIDAPENETGSCYGGGFIDDLSAPRRVIISPTNETYYSYYNDTTGIGFFAGPFMDALTPNSQAWNDSCNSIDSDGVTSVLEAYEYSYNHDLARKAVRNPSGVPENDPWRQCYGDVGARSRDESPWLDDGGNFLPTFMNGTDVGVGLYGYDSADGELARYTWLASMRYSRCVEDINDDQKVDGTDVSWAASCFCYCYPVQWSSRASLADVNCDNKVDGRDISQIARKFGWHI
jgi:hypothetical protein